MYNVPMCVWMHVWMRRVVVSRGTALPAMTPSGWWNLTLPKANRTASLAFNASGTDVYNAALNITRLLYWQLSVGRKTVREGPYLVRASNNPVPWVARRPMCMNYDIPIGMLDR